MGLLDKVKAGAEQAAAKAKEEAKELQTKRELGQAYGELGRTAFDLVERGELSHAELTAGVERIRVLRAQLEELGGSPGEPVGAAASSESEPPPPSAPPAMPS